MGHRLFFGLWIIFFFFLLRVSHDITVSFLFQFKLIEEWIMSLEKRFVKVCYRGVCEREREKGF